MMNRKAYILIDAVDGRADEVLAMLQGKPSIAAVDCVEGPPDIVMLVEAEEPQKLAGLTIQALTSVAHLTNSIRCLPVSYRGVGSVKIRNEMERRARL
jgi:hypothetical protein